MSTQQPLENFFRQYEGANSAADACAIASMYAETFTFAGPNGVRTLRREDFLKIIPGMKAHFESLGLAETRLHSVEAAALDSKYVLAKVEWKMTVRAGVTGSPEIRAWATYLLERSEADTLAIFVQIDHLDLAASIQNLRTRASQ
jgi:hypothetical protein